MPRSNKKYKPSIKKTGNNRIIKSTKSNKRVIKYL